MGLRWGKKSSSWKGVRNEGRPSGVEVAGPTEPCFTHSKVRNCCVVVSCHPPRARYLQWDHHMDCVWCELSSLSVPFPSVVQTSFNTLKMKGVETGERKSRVPEIFSIPQSMRSNLLWNKAYIQMKAAERFCLRSHLSLLQGNRSSWIFAFRRPREHWK